MTPFTILIILLVAAFVVSFGIWLYTGGGDFYSGYSVEGTVALVTVVALALCLTGGAMRVMGINRCETRADEMHTTQRWGYVAGCRLKVDGKYVPEEKVRFTDLVED